MIGPVPTVTSMGSTSISLTWSVPPSLGQVEDYEVTWQVVTGLSEISGSNNLESSGLITETSYTMEDLLTSTVYSITVVANTNITNQKTINQPIISFTGTNLEICG